MTADLELPGRSPRPALLSSEELRGIHVKLAVLGEKMDRVLEDRARIVKLEEKIEEKIEERISELERFNSQIKVWGIVGGAAWSLILTLISLKVWA
jgi:hypothetical protein